VTSSDLGKFQLSGTSRGLSATASFLVH